MEQRKFYCSMPQKRPAILGIKADPDWMQVSENIPILQMNGVTKEHAQYKGEGIKQADVNLLAYPLKAYYRSCADKKRPGLLPVTRSEPGHTGYDPGCFCIIICTSWTG